MKKLVIGLLFFGNISAQASMLEVNGPLDETFFEAQLTDEKTMYETLGDLFKTGKRPDLAKISNIAWAGRCFLKQKQNEPTNAGYFFRPKRTSDKGPIAANSKSYEAASYWLPLKSPNYFDRMSLDQVMAEVPVARKLRDVKIQASSIEVKVAGVDKSNLKASGNYLVEEISGLDGDVGPAGKVTIFSRCYYFNQN